MVLCKRRGCGVEFDPEAKKARCQFHPGAPVFHEGLKSWSCCKDTNKPVLEFDQFLQIPGCAEADGHTTERQEIPEPPKKEEEPADVNGATEAVRGVNLETTPAPAPAAATPVMPTSAPKDPAAATPAAPRPPPEEPRDPEHLRTVTKGSSCRRPGCGFTAESDIQDRDPSKEECRYHRGTPIFYEGSKGYTCCKRRVLDFDDFLQIEPCTRAEHGHLFTVPPPPADTVQCRIDHYETPGDVRVTVYAKGVLPDESKIEIQEEQVVLSLCLGPTPSIPHKRRFERTLQPYAKVDAGKSSYSLGKVKLDMTLVKQASGVSWPTLERGEQVFGYGLTFGRQQ